MGHKPLTPPQIILALLVLVIVPFGVMALIPDVPDGPKRVAYIGLGFCLSIAALCLLWHRTVYGRPDLVPDVLGRAVDDSLILQAGAAHVAGFATQEAGVVRFQVLAQNRFDSTAPLHVELRFREKWLSDLWPPGFDCELPGSGLLQAECEVAMVALSGPVRAELVVRARSPVPKGARQVRFARRNVVAPLGESWTIATSLMNGPLIAFASGALGSRTGQLVPLSPVPVEPGSPRPVPRWRVRPVDDRDIQAMASSSERLRRAL